MGYYEEDDLSVTLTEYLPGGELFRYISKRKYQLTEAKCQRFTKQILLAVEYMHTKKILHLDLKPENIILVHDLMNENEKTSSSEALKIIDFGLAKNLGIRNRIPINMCGTLEFISPEVLRCSHASTASDMWSVGVIIYMLISGGVSPFWAGTEYGTQYRIHRALLARGGFTHRNFKNVSKASIDCASMLLQLDPKSRPSATECLKHKWISCLASRSEETVTKRLECESLRKYLARRRWKRWFITIKALNRMKKMGETLSNTRSSIQKNKEPTSSVGNQSTLVTLKKSYETPTTEDQTPTPKPHESPIIHARGLSDRLKQLMMQNYGDSGMR